MMRWLPWLLALLLCAQVAAAATPEVDVGRDGARYHVEMTARLDTAPALAYAVFSDWRRLPQINPAVRSVAVLPSAPTGATRLATTIHLCVAFFCRELNQVQDITTYDDRGAYTLSAEVLPQFSDLRYGHAQWRMTPCAAVTCLHFTTELEPRFWVPPLIGPWLIERKLREQALVTSAGIERLARQAAP